MTPQLPVDPTRHIPDANEFAEVFASELIEIGLRQSKARLESNDDHGQAEQDHGSADAQTPPADPKNLAGLALSGGGIRSATSSLGALQALRKMGILPVFDYLSTVSGGGFTGSWWSAWTSRNFDSAATANDKFFPPPERTQPERDEQDTGDARDARAEGSDIDFSPTPEVSRKRREASDPAHHLRLFSNYLTPSKGLMSSDTWRAITVVSRNLSLTWLVMLPMLFAVVLIAQAYFTLQPDSETEFLYPYSHIQEDKELNAKLQREMKAATDLELIVHRSDSASRSGISLDRLREEAPGLRVEQSRAIDNVTDSLQKDERADSAVSASIGEADNFKHLSTEIDSVDHFARELRAMDSLHALAGTQNTPAADSARKALRQDLIEEVDTVHTKLREMQSALVRHRWEERDAWLFNPTHLHYLTKRLLTVSYLPIALMAWVIMFITLWMANVSNAPAGGNILQGSFAYVVGLLSFWGMLAGFPLLLGESATPSWDALTLMSVSWAVIALGLLSRVIWDEAHRYWKGHRAIILAETGDSISAKQELARLLEVRRTRILLSHERLLLTTFIVTVWLLFGGFGHELINYLFNYHPLRSDSTGDLWQWLIRLSSVAVVISALTGSAFAAKSSMPSSGADRKDAPKPSKIKGMLMSFAPPLILLILVCGISWIGHWVLQSVVFRTEDHSNRNLITIILFTWLFAGAAIYYVIEEFKFRKGSHLIRRILLGVQIGISAISLIELHNYEFIDGFRWVAITITALAWLAIVRQTKREKRQEEKLRSASDKESGSRNTDRPAEPSRAQTQSARGVKTIGAMVGTMIVILVLSQAVLITAGMMLVEAKMPFHWPYLMGIAVSTSVLLCELIWGGSGNREARILLGGVISMCTLFLFIPTLSEDPHLGITHVLATLVSVALGLVIYIGWRLDPNALSIHTFYRARIVRAYLGASNWLRGRASVSEVHPNDDIALSRLSNVTNGAPYHIVNTTLNLLGTKSLEAAQRHASNFIMSKNYCGSVTTGYRRTEEYMSGEMTLGTAVAISGAAASPNMGSATQSGAVTMLMSLLNIRLGYWAPNPMGSRWRDAQPRFWPYYLIMESLSKTTGLGAFCYLTDGGHFDNTGLYPLIERACRYIVVCDNGADPMTHFNDIGNAFRRCRIDFGVEFDQEGLREMTGFAAPTGSTRQHWLRGTVTYSKQHLRTIWGPDWDQGMSDAEREKYRTGTILILKPVVLGDEPADVLQYGLQHADFPQQSTANQWFTENQFESYRRLGFWSAQTAFGQKNYEGTTREQKLAAIREVSTASA